MVSIIVLTHNALNYCQHTFKTLRKTDKKTDYEVIVLDNNSNLSTQKKLLKWKQQKLIDKLIFLNENTLFSKGNNIASKLCSSESDYILLLNSDVEIRNKEWLTSLLQIHTRGATGLGRCSKRDNRPDGFCYLIDKDLFYEYQLNEKYAWWWSIAKLNADLLNDGYEVITVMKYHNILYHFGGKSVQNNIQVLKNVSGMDTEEKELIKWFNGKKCRLVNKVQVSKASHIETRNYYLRFISYIEMCFGRMNR